MTFEITQDMIRDGLRSGRVNRPIGLAVAFRFPGLFVQSAKYSVNGAEPFAQSRR